VKISLLVALCVTSIAGSCVTALGAEAKKSDRPFVHPGILHSQAELDFIADKIRSGEQPWKAEWQTLRGHRFAQLVWQPKPREVVARGAYNNPNIGASDLMNDAAAAYTHALQWSLTGEKEHADKAAQILAVYSVTLKQVTHHDARLLVGMSGIQMVSAAELLRHSDANWPRSQQKEFEHLLRTVLYPVIADFYPSANGNWDASMIQTMMAMGVFLDDREMFDRATTYFLSGKGNGAITHYFSATGQCQESGRDQGHTQMGLGYLACSAEIAWKQGLDLYAAADSRLAKGYEYTAKYNLGHDVSFKPYRSFEGRYQHTKISDRARGRFSPIYQLLHHHYITRTDIPLPYTAQVIAKNWSEPISTTYSPWTTLMFGKLPGKLPEKLRRQ